MIKLKKLWTNIFWNMAEGNKTTYDSLRGTDYVEFWDLREQYEARIEREIAHNRKK